MGVRLSHSQPIFNANIRSPFRPNNRVTFR
jgi:hypothetical protein